MAQGIGMRIALQGMRINLPIEAKRLLYHAKFASQFSNNEQFLH